jgi:hypothetical protein
VLEESRQQTKPTSNKAAEKKAMDAVGDAWHFGLLSRVGFGGGMLTEYKCEIGSASASAFSGRPHVCRSDCDTN